MTEGAIFIGPLTAAEWEAVRLSLKVSLWSVLGCLPLALFLAYILARRRFPGIALLDGLVHLPLVLPPVVIGYLLLLFFGATGPGGRLLEGLFGVTVAFRWTGAAIAAAVMGLPLMVRAIRLSIENIDRRLEVAARTLGARRSHVFFTVTLPLALPGIVAGAILCFAKSFGEFGATITFVSNIPGETQTLPIAVYSALQVPGGEGAALRLSVIAIVISMAALVGSEWFSRRLRRGRSRHEL